MTGKELSSIVSLVESLRTGTPRLYTLLVWANVDSGDGLTELRTHTLYNVSSAESYEIVRVLWPLIGSYVMDGTAGVTFEPQLVWL